MVHRATAAQSMFIMKESSSMRTPVVVAACMYAIALIYHSGVHVSGTAIVVLLSLIWPLHTCISPRFTFSLPLSLSSSPALVHLGIHLFRFFLTPSFSSLALYFFYVVLLIQQYSRMRLHRRRLYRSILTLDGRHPFGDCAEKREPSHNSSLHDRNCEIRDSSETAFLYR